MGTREVYQPNGNLKAELEIRHLHEKMDHLITRQWQRLAEIQQVQLEMLQEAQLPKRKPHFTGS